MARFVSVMIMVLALMAFSAVSGAAQDDDELSCETLSQEEAQAALDADPTYAMRGQLDSNEDGIACNEDETDEETSSDDATTDDETPGLGAGGRTETPAAETAGTPDDIPATGIGTMAGSDSQTMMVVLFALAGVSAAISLLLRRRPWSSARG